MGKTASPSDDAAALPAAAEQVQLLHVIDGAPVKRQPSPHLPRVRIHPKKIVMGA